MREPHSYGDANCHGYFDAKIDAYPEACADAESSSHSKAETIEIFQNAKTSSVPRRSAV